MVEAAECNKLMRSYDIIILEKGIDVYNAFHGIERAS